jgi:heme/copper-type cytochrome/quinol oxidase subunit 1
MFWLLTWMIFFGEIYLFLQLNRIGLYRTKRRYFHLEKDKLQDVFLSKTK